MILMQQVDYDAMQNLSKSGYLRDKWIGRVGDNTPADLFCVGETEADVQEWIRHRLSWIERAAKYCCSRTK